MRQSGSNLKKRTFFSVLLCAALLCAGPFAPMRSYASLDEDAGYVEGGDSGAVVDSGSADSADEDEDEPSYDNNATIQKLQQEIDQANEQLKAFQEQQKEIQAKISNAQSIKGEAEGVRNSYGQMISATEGELAALSNRIYSYQEKIALLEENIAETQAKIEKKQAEIDYNYDLFKQRLRAKYMQDNGTVLGLLLGADSFADFLTRTEYMSRIGQHDKDLMEELTIQRVEIENDKAELEETKQDVEKDKAQVENDKAATEVKRQEQAILYTAADRDVQDAARMEAEFNANLEQNKAMQAAMKAEIDKLYRELEFSKNPYVGGEMAWPLPGYTTISSYYGSRFGGSDFHTGTDITGSGCLGSAVVSANDGVVAFVNTSYSNGVGYGIYILVDHGVNDKGQSVSTLYAHLSSAGVSVGQSVKRGETIGACGSTGWSTGPHLHFEVRLNGSAVNSLPYIQK